VTQSVAAGGDAVGRDEDGRVVFVTGALPGERVHVAIDEEHARYAKGHVLEVEDPSPARVAPPCPHVAEGCGGCTWQHVELGAQRQLKVDIVTEALARLGGVDEPAVDPGPNLAAAGFRTTVRMGVVDGRAAFRKWHSHDLLPIADCLVVHPLLQDMIDTRRFDGATDVTLRCGARTGETLTIVDGIAEPDHFHETVAGTRFHISAHSFFQVRPDGADALVDEVRTAMAGAPDGLLVDAYGGVGLFAATVAGDRPVMVVEWSRSSVADAKVNVPEAKVVRVDVERWRPEPAAVVVADPARTGLGKTAVDRLGQTGATHLVLVSCDPASLGRDTALLAGHGFIHDGSTLVDLFPHTTHVEVVTRFIRDTHQRRTPER
jgi:23S rRNA (uracil1939-C5)-methyltransferase